MAAPIDCSILWSSDFDELKKTVETALYMGYESVVINYIVEGDTSTKKCLDPSILRIRPSDWKEIKEKYPKAQQFLRFTVIASLPAHMAMFSSNVYLSKFDIVSVQPRSEKVLQMVTSVPNKIDLLTFNPLEKMDFLVKRNQVNRARFSGMQFEISYSPALKHPDLRRNVLANAVGLIQATQAKNIIISSGAAKAIELRSPFDVMNLGSLFGLKAGPAKAAVTTNPASLLVRSRIRITGLSSVDVVLKDEQSEGDAKDVWLIKGIHGLSSSEDEDEEDEGTEGGPKVGNPRKRKKPVLLDEDKPGRKKKWTPQPGNRLAAKRPKPRAR